MSSAADASLHDDLTHGCPYDVGLRVQRQLTIGSGGDSASAITRRTIALGDAVAQVRDVAPAITTVFGGTLQITGARVPGRVQLVSRTGAFAHVHVLASVKAAGIWLPDRTARAMQVKPGDQIAVVGQTARAQLTVQAVFSDLTYARRDISWCSLQRTFEPFQLYTPPPTALLDQGLLERVLARIGQSSTVVWWEYPPRASGWTEVRAQKTISGLRAVAAATNNASLSIGQTLGPGAALVDNQGALKHAHDAGQTASASVGPVALGAAGVALLALLVAARTWLDRRRQEIVILAVRGAGPGAIALKGVFELVVPIAAGAAVGFGAGYALVRAIGPSALIDAHAAASAAWLVGAALAIALALTAILIVLGARRIGSESDSAARRAGLFLWEPIVLAVAGAAYYELTTRTVSSSGGARVDSLVLLFPVLLIAAGGGLLARVVLSGRVLRRGTGRRGAAAWLGVRRVAAGRRRAVPVVTGAAVSIGIVVFAGTLAASLRATIHAKATLGIGAAQVVTLSHPQALPSRSPLRAIATEVTRTTESTASPLGHEPADVLGVEPETFARAAYFDRAFADQPLTRLLKRLREPTGTPLIPAIAVGPGLPDRMTLALATSGDRVATLPVVVVARARAFPGYQFESARPLVIVDRSLLDRAQVVDTAQLWLDRDNAIVTGEIAASGLVVTSVARATTLVPSELEPQVWALQYLQWIGFTAGLVTFSGLGLYFAAIAERRRMSSSLARRMGLRRRSAVGATATEIGAMLGVGLVLGAALAYIAVRLVFDHVDLAPQIAPAPLFRFDIASVLLCATGVGTATLLVTAIVESRAERASLPELLRHAG